MLPKTVIPVAIPLAPISLAHVHPLYTTPGLSTIPRALAAIPDRPQPRRSDGDLSLGIRLQLLSHRPRTYALRHLRALRYMGRPAYHEPHRSRPCWHLVPQLASSLSRCGCRLFLGRAHRHPSRLWSRGRNYSESDRSLGLRSLRTISDPAGEISTSFQSSSTYFHRRSSPSQPHHTMTFYSTSKFPLSPSSDIPPLSRRRLSLHLTAAPSPPPKPLSKMHSSCSPISPPSSGRTPHSSATPS